MDGWDITFLIVAGYVAVISLVRLMRARHRKLIADLRRRLQKEQARIKQQERRDRARRRRHSGAA